MLPVNKTIDVDVVYNIYDNTVSDNEEGCVCVQQDVESCDDHYHI